MDDRWDLTFTDRYLRGPERARHGVSQTDCQTPVPTPEWHRIPRADYDTFDGLSNLNTPLANLSLQERQRTKLTNRKKVLAYQRSHHQRLAELLASQQAAAKSDTNTEA